MIDTQRHPAGQASWNEAAHVCAELSGAACERLTRHGHCNCKAKTKLNLNPKLRSKRCKAGPALHKTTPMRCDRRCLPEIQRRTDQLKSARNQARTKVAEAFLGSALANITSRCHASAKAIQRPARRAMLRKVLSARAHARESHVAAHLRLLLRTRSHTQATYARDRKTRACGASKRRSNSCGHEPS